MATRMQQRRGTAAQWISTNEGNGPILSAGEIGFESNTGKFKIGDGLNHWIDLDYFLNETAISGSISGYVESSLLGQPDGVATLDSNGKLTSEQLPDIAQVSVHAVADSTARLALSVEPGDIAIQTDNGSTYILTATPASTSANWSLITVADPFPSHDTDDLAEGSSLYFTNQRALDATTSAYDHSGAASTAETNAKSYADTLASNYDPAGAADTAESNAKSFASGLASNYDAVGSATTAETNAKNYADTLASSYDVSGAAATALQDAKDYADGLASDYDASGSATTALQDAKDYADGLAVNYDAAGAADDAETAAKLYADGLASNYDVAGAATTAETNAKNYADGLASNYDAAGTASSAVSTHSSDTTSVHGIADTSALATKTYADDAVSTHSSDTTNVHGIADTATLATKTYADDAAGTAETNAKAYADAMTTSDISEGTNLYYTDERVRDAIGTALTAGTGISVTVSDALDTITVAVDSSIATKTYADNAATTAVAAVIDAAPSTLDTLNELAAALGDDANFSTTITNSLAAKAPIESPSFNNGISINYGAIVMTPTSWSSPYSIVGNGASQDVTLTLPYTSGTFALESQVNEKAPSLITINAQTNSYTLVLSDKDCMVEQYKASANIITVPTNASVEFPVGTQITILQTGAGQTSVVGDTGVVVNGTPGLKLRAQWSSAILIKRATDTWVLVGDLTA